MITYTERAAGELRARIRAALLERGRSDLALELDGAWVSTIHGFCRRMLGAYPLAAGIDPSFRVLDEPQALVLQAEAFSTALERVLRGRRAGPLAAARDLRRRRASVRCSWSVYATLRSAGRELVLESGARGAAARAGPDAARGRRWLCATTRPRRTRSVRPPRAALELVEATTLPERLLALADLKTRGPRAAAFAEARDALVAAALEELAARDRELLQELLTTFAAAYGDAKERESALDFEDLQLRARDLLRDDPAIRERERQRFRSIMVDEFQDTNRLQTELLDLLCEGPDADLFVVGDEFQSIYGFRHADVAVFRERRSAAPTVLPLTRNHRSRPEVLAAVNELFGGEFGDEFQRLEPADGCRRPALRNAFELLVTDKAADARDGRPLAPVRGASRRPARPRARRRGRRDARRDRAALRRRHRRRVVRGGAAGGRPADVPRRRSQLLRPAAGRRSALLPAAPPQPLRRRGAARRCSRRRSSACRTTRSS